MQRGAVFFDRDGVLNREVGFAYRPEEIEWTPGVAEAIRLANEAGHLAFVVTNQSGIARGYFGEADLESLHRWMTDTLAAQGARIDGFAWCPHHPEGIVAAYTSVCDCRKPAPGMILRLIAEHDIDPARSILIGDRETDLQAAEAAGVRGLLFSSGELPALVREGLALTA